MRRQLRGKTIKVEKKPVKEEELDKDSEEDPNERD